MTVFYLYVQAPRYVHIIRVVAAIVMENPVKSEAGPASRNYFLYCGGEFLSCGTESYSSSVLKSIGFSLECCEHTNDALLQSWEYYEKVKKRHCSGVALSMKVRECCSKTSL